MTSNKANLKVLLVEDQPIIMQVHTKMLTDLGFKPDGAETAAQAISLARNQYDIIFMDIGLPDGNGISVTKEIFAQSLSHKPIVVGITAYALDDVRQECLEAGMQQVLNKPVSQSTLETILLQYLQPQLV